MPKLTERYFDNKKNVFFLNSFVHAGQVLFIFAAAIVIYFRLFTFSLKVRLSLRPFCPRPVLTLGLSILDSTNCLFFD